MNNYYSDHYDLNGENFEDSTYNRQMPGGQLPSASTLPGYPTIPTSPVIPEAVGLPAQATPFFGLSPGVTAPTLVNPGYTQAFLRANIGRRARVEFLVGTNVLIDRDGVIEDVGISYIVLRESETNNRVMGDLYSIKFVTFYE